MLAFSRQIALIGPLCLLWYLPAQAAVVDQKNISIVGSNCVLVVQTDNDQGKEIVNKLTCPQDASKSYALRYIWLDTNQISLLLARYSDKNISPIFGDHPLVAKNSVYDELKSIFEKYGSKYSELSAVTFPGHFTLSGKDKPETGDALDISFRKWYAEVPIAVRRNIVFSRFEENIIWPDRDLSDSLQGQGWPSKYKYVYGSENTADETIDLFARHLERDARRNKTTLAEMVGECTTFYQLVNKTEFDGYWDRIDQLEKALTSEEIQTWQFDGSDADVDTEDFIQSLSSNPTYDFYADVGKNYWPTDLLVATGSISTGSDEPDCGEAGGGISLAVVPRSLYALVGVITPLSDPIVVRSARLEHDDTIKLRSMLSYAPDTTTTQLSELSLSQQNGNSLIIPLRLELRYDPDDLPLSQISTKQGDNPIFKVFQRYPKAPVNFKRCGPDVDGPDSSKIKCKSFLKQTLGDFPEPISTDVTGTYYFGPALQLKTLEINGKDVDVRDAPKFGLVVSDSGEYGSCPFAYFEMDNGSVLYQGRILVGASSPANAKIDHLTVPSGAKRLIIREIEPEITHVYSIDFSNLSNTVKNVNFSTPLRILPRQQISIEIPDGTRELTVSGYYDPLR
ncbi:hypothetical protein [Rhizobium leguminosarum]|uniref:hypothetical protein n=1 Tax=Rhizobium leguminosarum TaxID=384 RepID=UPI001031EE0E|nr:hypothetical protein [Rhizobium leguminosarum]TAY13747.1 hypothetical protein ELH96_19200 [Rhizobium leguminosarum]